MQKINDMRSRRLACWAAACLMTIAGALAVSDGPAQAGETPEVPFANPLEPIAPIPQPPVAEPRKLALGERLFADTRLSRDGSRACITCHDVRTNGADGNRRDRHHARGKLLPRERVEMLLDQDSPFLELSPVAAWGTEVPVGAGVVTGIGVVEGVECVLVANDPTIAGGAVNAYALAKIRRAARISSLNRLPLVTLVPRKTMFLRSAKAAS